jgi:DHA2 family multidrug resistance protein-like MFS transporter
MKANGNSSAAADAIAPKATSKEWLGLAVIALPCMLYSMDLTVLNLAVPELARDLRPTASQLLWIIDIYGFMVAGFLMIMGSLGDRFGRRRLLLIGAAAFGLMSVVAAFAASAEALIVSRAALGVAGATLAPSTLSLISNMFRDPAERTFAISMWVASFSVGAIIGPIVGGVLITWFWWGAVFLAGVPVMLLLLALGPVLLPEYRDPDARGIDYASALLSLFAVLGIIYGVKVWAEDGMGPRVLVPVAAGIVLGFVFFRRQSMLEDPFLDLRLFRSPVFSLSLAINCLGIFFMLGAFVFVAQYFQLVAGLTPMQAGIWSLPSAIAFTAVSMLTPKLVSIIPEARLVAYGLLLSLVGFICLIFAWDLLTVVLSSIVFCIGFTPVVTLTTGFIVGSAPPERAGIASAVSETGAELGGALGIACLGSLLTAVYRSRMQAFDTDGLPLDVAAAARSTLAGALQASERVAVHDAAPMIEAARAAFVDGFQATAVAGSIALALLAALAVRILGPNSASQSGETS